MNTLHPMRPVEFLILTVLQSQDQHGYGLVKAIEARTDGSVQLKAGNLYRVLDRLVLRGLVEHAETVDDGDERRRYYRITPTGREALSTEARLLGGFVDEVRAADTTGSEAL